MAVSPHTVETLPRVVVLGASNVARSFGSLTATIRRLWPVPLRIFSAHGHGRSYGQTSRVLVRKLPGIWGCGLWPALAASPAGPTYALVTDVGNDILYEVPVDRIVAWLEQCLDQLAYAQANTVVMGLPLQNLPGLSAARYRFFRTLFMPGCSLSLTETVRRAEAVDQQLQALAAARNQKFFRPQQSWYGIDPIHITHGKYGTAWKTTLANWRGDIVAAPGPTIGWYARKKLELHLPETGELCGKTWVFRQPCVRLSCGTTIALY